MRLIHKFFLTFIATNVLVVVLLVGLIGYHLSTDFNTLVQDTEASYVQQLRQTLAGYYQQHHSWEALQSDDELWRSLVNPARPDPAPPPPSQRDKQDRSDNSSPPEPREPPPGTEDGVSADSLKTAGRISLYDQDKRVVVGQQFIDEHPVIVSIEVDGSIVGWLGLMPSSLAQNSPAAAFLARQYKLYIGLGVGVSLIALLMAYWMSRHLSRPVQELAAGTRKIRDGDYSTRIQQYSSDEIGQLAMLVNDLAETLEANRNSRTRWMSDTSHELRTPLTIMKSQLTAVQEKIMAMDDRRILILIQEIDNLARLISDLGQLSSGDVGELRIHKELMDPLLLLGETLLALQPRFNDKHINLQAQLEGVSCELYGDAGRLRQLFSNLLENSLRYTDEGGRLQVQADIESSWLLLVFQDSKPGVSDDQLARLFERFYRVEKSRSRQYGGSGLGLAICGQIAEAHGGSIHAVHSPLGGVRMEVRLPLKQQPPDGKAHA